MSSIQRVTILGVEIDPVSMDEAIDATRRLLAKRRTALVFWLNVDILMKVKKDLELRAILDSADLLLVDGTPMMWAAWFLGSPLPGRVSGSDFVPAFCRATATEGHRIFLLGALPGVANAAKEWLERMNPGLRIVGTYSPPFGFERDTHECARIVSLIRAAEPDVLFAAFGTPKEQKWLFRFHNELGVPVSMGVGSTLDYLGGRLKRAPLWLQKAGLEWSYRLMQEPHRLWRRYLLEDPPFVFHIIKERLRKRPRISMGQ
jgi:N-acetylglucosaminyldiphosphoundecaprenol N-acetyl-beta-D-mannosaminyltransferase